MKSYQIRIEDGHHIVNMSTSTPPTLEQTIQNAAQEINLTIDEIIEHFRSLFKGE